MSAAIRVLLVEDQDPVRTSLERIVTEAPGLALAASVASGEAALEAFAEARPSVVLCDLGLPGIDGVETCSRLKTLSPEVEVLMFTVSDDDDDVLAAVQAGAAGYLLKGSPSAKITEAIEEVHRGGTVIQPNLARRLLSHFRQTAEPEDEGRSLTPRETEILQLIGKGLSNREAAEVLQLSRSTVRTHLENIYEKLDVTNRVEAVTEGLRKGLIEV